jgi:hypothetical protein
MMRQDPRKRCAVPRLAAVDGACFSFLSQRGAPPSGENALAPYQQDLLQFAPHELAPSASWTS